ncbi:MAG: hypothetical protein LQ338_002771 [Usnochroma carphineum]|nr:MAG: hypothetical protein LQ338_002771 [Usnochroma carphineum]
MTQEEEPLIPYRSVENYFATWESRVGYKLVLGGTRHHGYYKAGTKWPFPINPALRRMEDYLYNTLDLPPGSEVLDAGCGLCHVAMYFARKGLRVQGVDIVENHIRWAQRDIKAQGMEDKVSARVGNFQHLDHIPSGSLDGVFTMETFVHASNGKQVLSEFFRVLKPGGTLAMHEYWHVGDAEMPGDTPRDLIQSAKRVNKFGAMPTGELLTKGVMQQWLKDQGFMDIEEVNLSENIAPMSLFFCLLGYIPYLIICFFGLQAWFVNTEAGVQGYRALKRGLWGYASYKAKKPPKNISGEARLRRTG